MIISVNIDVIIIAIFSLKEIEKAIVKSNLGMTPTNDGQVIRLTLPPLTTERRKVCF